MFKKIYLLLVLSFLVFFSTNIFSITLNDSGKISATQVSSVIDVKSEADILRGIRKANTEHLPIAIMGKQHSQGGQSLADNAIVLDMLSFNKVLSIDVKKKQVTVQSGITWGELQKYINRYNLAITSMQSPNIFTVGGSVSVNAHGDDFRAGSVGNSVVSFNMLLANGKKIYVTPTLNPKLWRAVIGGYGLLGVITDVTLQLTDNDLFTSQYKELSLNDFPNYFQENVLNKKDVALFYAHLNIIPNDNFLDGLYVITYVDTKKLPNKIIPLDNPDKWNALLTPIFNISRYSKLGKEWRWQMERRVFKRIYDNKILTRNNAMEKPVKFASDYHGKDNADWLQEYFIPINKLPEFIKQLRLIILEKKINLLNVTIRYVPMENIILSYAREDCFAVVLYFNQNLSASELKKARLTTQTLIDSALSLGGSYYLPYQNFASDAQFKRAYPEYEKIIELKKIYDPKNIFMNKLYQTYFK